MSTFLILLVVCFLISLLSFVVLGLVLESPKIWLLRTLASMALFFYFAICFLVNYQYNGQ